MFSGNWLPCILSQWYYNHLISVTHERTQLKHVWIKRLKCTWSYVPLRSYLRTRTSQDGCWTGHIQTFRQLRKSNQTQLKCNALHCNETRKCVLRSWVVHGKWVTKRSQQAKVQLHSAGSLNVQTADEQDIPLVCCSVLRSYVKQQ